MVEKLLNKLKLDIRFRDKIVHVEIIDPKEPVYGQIDDLPENIERYLSNNDIKLYKHQCKAIEFLRDGKNVLITTPTASGKTLAFNLPILEHLNKDGNATALYIYPAKALANDQLKVLKDLEESCEVNLTPNIYDGDTEKDRRPWIRENSRIILTNPYELHLILYWHHQWARFYSNLKYIVIDEAHQYRGVFGSNVAFLIRRLRRICKYYGSEPQFILSSATLANPLEFSGKLVGLDFELISEDGSPRERKYFIFYNPYVKSGTLSVHQETKNLFLFFVIYNLQTLCFTISRKMAELIAMWSKKEIDESRPDLTEKITAYRAGYLPEDRRKIENGLKNRDLIGVTTTNALELGINIGSLDVVIISGYPGTVISTWQQVGRAGRGTGESIAVLVAFQNPLDQYFMKYPGFFFDKAHENAIVDLTNLHILYGHLICSVYELPLTIEDLKEFYKVDDSYLQDLKYENIITETQEGWIYIGKGSPTFEVNLNNISSNIFSVLYNGKLLEKMERTHAYREAHQGAVLINQGESYIVERFDLAKKIINVVKRDVDYHTQPLRDAEIKVLNKIRERKIGDFSVFFGDLEVSEYYHKYNLMNYGKVIATYDLDLPPLRFRTKGLWFTLPVSVKEKLEIMVSGKDVFAGGFHGTEHALIAMFPLHVMCDRFDIGGLSTPLHPDTKEATIFIYDAFEGGIGLADKAVDLIEELVKVTYEMVSSCECDDGCPSCIYSPKCGNENKPLNKRGTLFILKRILDIMGIKSPKTVEHIESPVHQKVKYTKVSVGAEAYREYNLSKSWDEKGKSLYNQEKFDAALEFFDKSLEVNPKNIEALKYKGMILEIKGLHEKAVKFYDKALEIEPKDSTILYYKALSIFNSENYKEAVRYVLKSLKINPECDDAWYLMGLSLEYLGDDKEALNCYKKTLEVNPKHFEASEKNSSLSK